MCRKREVRKWQFVSVGQAVDDRQMNAAEDVPQLLRQERDR